MLPSRRSWLGLRPNADSDYRRFGSVASAMATAAPATVARLVFGQLKIRKIVVSLEWIEPEWSGAHAPHWISSGGVKLAVGYIVQTRKASAVTVVGKHKPHYEE